MERIPSGATRVIFGIALALCCGCASFERDNRYALGLRRNYSTERQLRLLQAVVRNQQSELESIRERNSVLEQRLTKRRQVEARSEGLLVGQASLPGQASSSPVLNSVPKQRRVPVPFEPSASQSDVQSGVQNAIDSSVAFQSSSAPSANQSFNASLFPGEKHTIRRQGLNRSAIDGIGEPPGSTAREGALKSTDDSIATTQAVLPVYQEETGEHFLYSKILDTYRTRSTEALQKTLQMLLKTYPDSIFADNGLYLAGLLAFEAGKLGQAKFYMDQLVRDYPTGNKVVSALFMEAMIEKQSKNFGRAKLMFERVAKLFPGSPEAAKVNSEIKSLRFVASQRQGV